MEWLESCLAKNKFGLPERVVKLEKDDDHSACLGCIRSKDNEGNDILLHKLAAQYKVIIEEVIPTYAELRRPEYAKRIDPKFQEAQMDNLMGKPEKLRVLIEEYKKIKQEFPKPNSIKDESKSGEEEWL
jgi:hypothetical protein